MPMLSKLKSAVLSILIKTIQVFNNLQDQLKSENPDFQSFLTGTDLKKTKININRNKAKSLRSLQLNIDFQMLQPSYLYFFNKEILLLYYLQFIVSIRLCLSGYRDSNFGYTYCITVDWLFVATKEHKTTSWLAFHIFAVIVLNSCPLTNFFIF